ncbi:Sec63 Brl domain-containing protein [Cladochytrium replicatum]|nr:Sec63 Brl domain-containing protein [Cladochytrium replicatum]
MAEHVHRGQQYQYTANSNLVLQADRTGSRRDQEPSGEPETLYGRINAKQFGDRAVSTLAEQKEKIQKKRKKEDEKRKAAGASELDSESRAMKKKKERERFMRGYGLTDVLAATEDLEGLSYRPRTRETRKAYEFILSFVHERLGGDIPQDVLRGATDEVLAILKDDTKKDFDRKAEIESLTSSMDSHKFSQLVNLGKQITDYHSNEGAGMAVDETGREQILDEEHGVAVIIDEEDDVDEDDRDDEFVRDEDDDEDSEEENGQEADVSNVLRASGANDGDEQAGDQQNNEFTTVVPLGQKKAKSAPNAEVSGGGFGVFGKAQTTISPHEIDSFWLQRNISIHFPDAHVAQVKTDETFKVLSSSANGRDCENQLMALFDYDKFDLVKLLTRNRELIVWCTRLARASTPAERKAIEDEMRENGAHSILEKLGSGKGKESQAAQGSDAMEVDNAAVVPSRAGDNASEQIVPKTTMDLETMAFQQGGHLMSNKKVKLPEGSFKRTKKGYEEVHIPMPKPSPMGAQEKLVPIGELPEWARVVFKKTTTLNRIQSRVYPIAFLEDDPMLLCAPTGAGKTNCAMLTILHEVGKHRNEAGEINLDAFKIVYVAPMKALVAEMVGNFGERLEPLGIKVAELSGDRTLTKAQIAETQVIVTTPEKWDVITRKANERSYTNIVRLLIVDEIHLLHDDRGPVLESIISRTIRQMEQTNEPVRIVGLSATLPNYVDVAAFLRVDPQRGLFFFDNTFRPVPLKQQYIGITEKKALKRFQLMNEILYEKVLEDAQLDNQMIVFCHSRKETAKTAKAIKEMAIENDTIGQILRQDADGQEERRNFIAGQVEEAQNADLKELLPFGFGIHHAGMTRGDREMVEELFANGFIRVLVSTATLAWGVNLPAHTVVIKGTQIYSPEKGRWVELSTQDVLQMMGRAGRPQYDTEGLGIILTTHQELQFYLSLLNQQLPIESQLVSKLADMLNAEIVLGTIRNRDDAAAWLRYTYLYIRMRQNPSLYHVNPQEVEEDPTLLQKRIDLIHSAATILDKCSLVNYDKKTGRFQVTELGRIASHYYISHQSMATYNQHLKPTLSLIDLFRVFALSDEFKFIPVREEEKLELTKLLERVPIPVKESVEEPTAKINVLLQAYISQLKLEGFALMSDMVYVTQSASRILRAVFEICLKRGWAQLTHKALDLCKMVDKRMWLSMSPLRQFQVLKPDVIRLLERKEVPWERYYDLTPEELGELAKNPKMRSNPGKSIYQLVHQFPKLELEAHVLPITQTMLRIDLTITPDFQFDEKVHKGGAEMFWVLVEDVDCEWVLFHDIFILKRQYASEEHSITFTVRLQDPLPPNYFVSVISDRWLNCETRLPISFRHLMLPAKPTAHTQLLDLQPLPVSALRSKEYEAVYSGTLRFFNPIQTQSFHALYENENEENVFVGAPPGSGKTVCAEFALLRMWKRNRKGRCVYVAPFEEVVELKAAEWRAKFGKLMGGKNVVVLTGEVTADLKLLEQGDIIFSTPQKWDMLSRRWKQRKNVQTVGLFVIDDVHLLGGDIGPTIEIIVSRMRSIASQTENKIRIVALGASVANAKDIGDWIGAKDSQSFFNFSPNVRPVPLEIHIQGYNIQHFPSLMIAMTKPMYLAITQLAGIRPSIVFVPSRKQCRLTSLDLVALAEADPSQNGGEKRFLHCSDDDLAPHLEAIQDRTLAESVSCGVGFYHEALSKSDQRIVERLFKSGAIQVVVASKDTCWGIPLRAHLVVLMGTQYFEGKEHRYADYQITDVLQMMGRASRPALADGDEAGGKCVLMCQAVKKDFYKFFLNESLPVESHLDQFLHDHFNAEIVTKTIENKHEAVDYLTWTFLYRRLVYNPNYYNLTGNTQRHLSDYLSELVERTIDDLATSKCISVDNEVDVSPLNLGMISAYYYINYQTIELFAQSLGPKTKIRGLLEIITAAAEFEDVQVRHHEDGLLRRIYSRCPVKLSPSEGSSQPKFNDPHVKAHILMQAHFSRLQLPPDLESDQRTILSQICQLIQACVDVISSSGWLMPALAAMELSQMAVQAVWNSQKDGVLRQVPQLTQGMIDTLHAQGVKTVFDLADMEDEDRNKALEGLDAKRMAEVARFVNAYPSIEVSIDAPKEPVDGGMVRVDVTLEREMDEDEEVAVAAVVAPFYPGKKDEAWWVVVGEPSTGSLLGIKRTTVQKRGVVKLEFAIPEGKKKGDVLDLKVFLMCDSYMGVDQEFQLSVTVGEVVDEEEEEDEDAMEE